MIYRGYKDRNIIYEEGNWFLKDISILDIAVSGVDDLMHLTEEIDHIPTLYTVDVWMEMMTVRNQLAHDYDSVIVKKYCSRIVEVYIAVLYDLRKEIEKLII